MYQRLLQLPKNRSFFLFGARNTGKSTLIEAYFPADHCLWFDLLDTKLEHKFTLDPDELFHIVKGLPKTITHVVIDEVQKAPDLLPAIKKVVDQNNRPGQFLITGSANILSLPTVTESLAGRIGKIRLRPLSQGEIVKTSPDFLKNAFQGLIGSSPVAAVLVWRLLATDRRARRLEERIIELTDAHTNFIMTLAGVQIKGSDERPVE